MPISMTLESCDGNVKLPYKTLTCPRRVTGNYKALDWSKFQDLWLHLWVCTFLEPPNDPIVDMLISKDHIDPHFSKHDVKEIIGTNRANLTCTFFTRRHIFNEINDSLKRFWVTKKMACKWWPERRGLYWRSLAFHLSWWGALPSLHTLENGFSNNAKQLWDGQQ